MSGQCKLANLWKANSGRCWYCGRDVPFPQANAKQGALSASREHRMPRAKRTSSNGQRDTVVLAHRLCNQAAGALWPHEKRRLRGLMRESKFDPGAPDALEIGKQLAGLVGSLPGNAPGSLSAETP